MLNRRGSVGFHAGPAAKAAEIAELMPIVKAKNCTNETVFGRIKLSVNLPLGKSDFPFHFIASESRSVDCFIPRFICRPVGFDPRSHARDG